MAIDWEKNTGIDLNMTITNATLSHNFSNFMCCFQSMAVIMYSTIALTVGENRSKENNISTQLLILKMDFPFRADTQIVYGFMMVVQFLYLLFSAIILGMINAFVIVLVRKLLLF